MKSNKEATREKIISTICDIIEKDPESNIETIIKIAKTVVRNEYDRKGVEMVEHFYRDVPSMKPLLHRITTEIDPKILRTFFRNFVANAIWNGGEKREKFYKEHGAHVPFALLISPSMKCNLRCTGCYAADWDKSKGLTYEEVDRIVGEARDLGIYFMFILGGEPYFVDYMWKIYEKYNDVVFLTFTNGSLFTDEVADKIKELKNVYPMFSLEGYEKETDERRGTGVYAKVMEGMEKLKSRGIPFGVSSATGAMNVDTVISDEFIDNLMDKGSFINWYFMFMPIGERPDVSMMLNPEQRLRMGERSNEIRHTKPCLTIDFFNDAPHVGGCIAGSYYCHVTASGDVEPCVFAHFTVDNIREKSLGEIFQSEFFKELMNRQPYNDNLLKPCMMIDNTNVIREVVQKVGARPTDESARAMIYDNEFKKKLDNLSAEFTPYADKAWRELYPEKCENVQKRMDMM